MTNAKEHLIILNKLSERIIGCAISVHRTLGPGLLESVYKEAFCIELEYLGISYKAEVPVSIHYRNEILKNKLRMDLVIENKIIVELKSVGKLIDVHKAQLISYMKLSKINLGLLLNFNRVLLKDGIFRMLL